MRIPSFPTFLRAFYTISNSTSALSNAARARIHGPSSILLRTQFIKSMPTLPFLGNLFSSSSASESTTSSASMTYPVQKSDDEWQAVLSPEQFRIIRNRGTEAPGSGNFDKHSPAAGVYTCAACDAPLYTAEHKFKSGCGWPAYFDSIPGAVVRHTDRTFGMSRTEIMCGNCGGHLGHVFKGEGYATPTDERHCVNSVSLTFHEKDDKSGNKVQGSSK